MPNSTAKAAKQKPSKPYPDFPLFPHASGVWAKKIKGEFKYFGVWDNPDAAYQKYKDFVEGKSSDGTTVKQLANAFLQFKETALDNGELSPRSFRDYHHTCSHLVEFFGRPQLVDELTPDDFGRYRAHLSKRMGLVSLTNEINRTRIVFRYGVDCELLERAPRFGKSFERPRKESLQRAKQAKGDRLFSAPDLRRIIAAAEPTMKAMVLLAINCGYGQTDIASLPKSAIDFSGAWITFPRPKTMAMRRCSLWKETVAALKKAMKLRPAAKDPADDSLVFLTNRGRPFVRTKRNAKDEIISVDTILPEFQALLDTLEGVPRLGFYRIRHTHRTVSDGALDKGASDAIMGHTDPSMAGNYTHGRDDARLVKVCEHIRKWLFPPKRAAK
jgi:integrase